MKLDLNLLKRLLVIDHPSKNEWEMISFIINECYKMRDLTFEMDAYSNIFVTKNTTNPLYYPAVICHMDCVLARKNKDIRIKDGKIYGKDRLTGKRIGLGADDANGICVALQLLKVIPDLKVCFTTEEEVGFLGADCASENIDFFCDVSYLIQADRRHGDDLITFTNGIYSASDDWLEKITGLMYNYNYKENVGIGTDVGVLAEKLQLSGVNISCGYYNEHTDKEYTVISELENCLNFMRDILRTVPLDKQYEIKVEYSPYNYNYVQKFRNYYDDDLTIVPDNNDWETWCNKCSTYDCMHCPHDVKWE